MIKILIAEDEQIEREFIANIVKTSQPEILLLQAENGEEALRLYQEHQPEIVFLDINMPVYNGLAVLQRIRAISGTASKVFILTAYDYFSYAQEAIHLGVEEFLLKPAEAQKIAAVLSSAVEKLKYERNHRQQTSRLVERYHHLRPLMEQDCISMIFSGAKEDELLEQLKLLNIHFVSGCCFLLDPLADQEIEDICRMAEDIGFSCLACQIDRSTILYVLAGFSMEKEDVRAIEQMIKSRAGIGARVGTIENELPALHQSYFHALNAACAQEEPDDDDERFCQIWVQKLFEAGASEEDELLRQTVHGYVLTLLYRKHGEPEEVSAMYGHVADMLCKKINAEEHEEFMQAQEIAAGINFSVPAKEAELRMTLALMRSLKLWRLMRYQRLDHMTRKAVEYIKANYQHQISLHDVAESLQISDSHLSRLLSKSNRGFSDLLNEYRIQQAKHQIRNGEMIKQVADQCGFRSQSYFTQIFRKFVGMSPKEYRDLFIQ